MRPSDFLIPIRARHYDLLPDQSGIDLRVVGVCNSCILEKNNFQQKNTCPVDINNKHLVFKNV